jgi:hypothetical protein
MCFICQPTFPAPFDYSNICSRGQLWSSSLCEIWSSDGGEDKMFLWVVTPCWHEGRQRTIFSPEDGDSTRIFLRNAGIYLRVHAASQPRRTICSASLFEFLVLPSLLPLIISCLYLRVYIRIVVCKRKYVMKSKTGYWNHTKCTSCVRKQAKFASHLFL